MGGNRMGRLVQRDDALTEDISCNCSNYPAATDLTRGLNWSAASPAAGGCIVQDEPPAPRHARDTAAVLMLSEPLKAARTEVSWRIGRPEGAKADVHPVSYKVLGHSDVGALMPIALDGWHLQLRSLLKVPLLRPDSRLRK